MKKNWTMRLGVTLLALTLITSCFVGGTFAKYTTSGSGDDTARVAKFGVTVTATGSTFATEYTSGQPGYENVTVVKSGTADKVVAPGTYGQMTGIKITGQPEVAVKITYEATKFDLGENWVDENGNYYCPLIIHVRNSEEDDPTKKTTLDGLSYRSVEEFEAAVKQAVTEYSQICKPGTSLTSQDNINLTIDWAWAFDETGRQGALTTDKPETGTVTGAVQDNVKDTFLGDQAAEGKAATVSLEVTTTVTQID